MFLILSRESLFTEYITKVIHINCYNGRLTVEALASHSWPPIKKHKTYIMTEKSAETKNVQK